MRMFEENTEGQKDEEMSNEVSKAVEENEKEIAEITGEPENIPEPAEPDLDENKDEDTAPEEKESSEEVEKAEDTEGNVDTTEMTDMA